MVNEVYTRESCGECNFRTELATIQPEARDIYSGFFLVEGCLHLTDSK